MGTVYPIPPARRGRLNARIPGLLALAAVALLALAACGPGGRNTLAIPTQFGGTVKVPIGTPTLAKPTQLARAQARMKHFLMPEAAALTGLETVESGVEVRLYAVDRQGNPFGALLDVTTTASDGSYIVTLPSWDTYDGAHPWVVAVGNEADGTLMRRMVDSTGALGDIDPASEAALRILLQDTGIPSLTEVLPFEIAELNDQVAAATATVSGVTLQEMVDVALEVARDNEGVQRRLIAISSTPDNTRPLARAGIDFRMTTGDTLNLLANAEDADGDLVSYRWTIDSAPPASLVERTPPIGRRLTFRADVDGTYVLRLVVTDANLAPSPPDFATIIATTPPIQVTINDTTDSQGAMTASRDLLVYTTAVRDAATNANYADVLIQQLSALGPVGAPLRLLPPGATTAAHVLRTVEGHPSIAANGAMVVYSSDMVSPGTGGGDFEVIAVDLARIGSPIQVTDNAFFDTQPDVQCPTASSCNIVWVSDADPAGTQLHAATLVDAGAGFTETATHQLTTDATDHFSPRLSRDGVWVVFTARDPVEDDLDIYRILADGSMAEPELLTPTPFVDPNCLIDDPTGDTCVLADPVDDDLPVCDGLCDAVVYRSRNAIWYQAMDGSDPVRVSGARFQGTHPSVSSDGTVIAFAGTTDLGTDLFSVLNDGSLLTQLTTDGSVSQPQVSTDGTRILFRSARDGDHDFYIR
jgi:hypothetical protein